MAQLANTYSTYDIIGIFDDLEDVVYNIDPTDTPLFSMAARMKAKQTFHEWLTDTLAAAVATNANIEGDEATADAQIIAVRVGNYTQIPDKVVVISGTAEATDSAADVASLSYQMAKRGKELKRDIESEISQNKASVAGNDTTARQSASFESWIVTNDNRGSGGVQGGFSAGIVAAPTDGTQRVFTETIMKDVIKLAWTAGGDPRHIILGPFNKQAASGFTGNATRFDRSEDRKVVATTDVYVSDFGTHNIEASRFSRDRSGLFIDPDYIGMAWLRPIQTAPLARTGDHERRQMLAEYTLVIKNEAAHGIAADLTTS